MKKKEIFRYLVVCCIVLAPMVPQICSAADMEVSARIGISEQLRHEWNPWPVYNSVDDEFFVVWRTSGVMREDCDPSDDYECVKSFQSIDGARISPYGDILREVVISPAEGPDENVSWKMQPRLDHNEFRNEYLMTFYMCEDVCAQCHTRDAEGDPDTINVAVCLNCHPGANPQGPACNLVDFHVDGNKVSPDGTIQAVCDDCHINCEELPPGNPSSNHPFSCLQCHVLEREDGANPVHYRAGHTAHGNKLYTLRIDSAGDTLTQPKLLYDPPVSSGHPAMVFNPKRRQYLLSTVDRYFTTHYDNLAFIVDEDATILKGPIFFGEGSDGSWSTFLYYVAYNPIDDTYLLPFEDFRHAPGAWYNGPLDIYAALLDGEGNTLADIPIMEDFDEGEYEHWYPGVAHNPDRNEFLVGWFDERPLLEDGGVVGRIVNADGTMKPDNVLADTNGSQGDVAIVYAPKHKMYFIVYQSTQNFVRSPDDASWYFENDIYARWVDADGLPVGDPIPIYLGEGDQTTPQVSYSPTSDKFLIVWWDTYAPDDYEPVPGETGQYGEISSVVFGDLGRGNVYGAIYGEPGPCAAKEIYGEDSKEVELMRSVRDNILKSTSEGQQLIKLYYDLSPAIVQAMKKNEDFKVQVKAMIDGVLTLFAEGGE